MTLRRRVWLSLAVLGWLAGAFILLDWQRGGVAGLEVAQDEAQRLDALAAELSRSLSEGAGEPARAAMQRALSEQSGWRVLTVRDSARQPRLLASKPGRAWPLSKAAQVVSKPMNLGGPGLGELTLERDPPPATGWWPERRALAWTAGALLAVLLAVGLLMELTVHRPLASVSRFAANIRRGAHAVPPRVRVEELAGVSEALGDLAGRLDRCRAARDSEAAERDRMRTSLTDTEARYALAVRGADDGLWEWDITTDRVYYSPRWKSMLGYGEDEVGSSPDEWRTRVHPEDLERTLEEVESHIRGVTPHFENEHRLRHRDGGYRWVLARGTAVRDEEGRPRRMLGLNTDITERKRAEQALWLVAQATSPLQGEPFFCSLVRAFAQALEAPYAFVTECLDYPATRVRTLAFWQGDAFVPNVEFDLAGTPCEEVVRGGKVYYLPRGAGDRYPVPRQFGMESYLGVPIFCSGGKRVIGHLAFLDRKAMPEAVVGSPILRIFAARAAVELERRQAEQALARVRAVAEAALAASAAGVMLVDARGQIERLNAAAERLTGWAEDDLRRQPIGRIFPAYVSRAALDEAAADAPAELLRRVRCEIFHKDGRRLSVEHSVSRFRAPGVPAATVLVFQRDGANLGGS
jgi:PAS domain S-box-containing protein